ncbi:MAG: DUF2029 domain-containing protein [Crocinitomicaceae bacterium]|nr:DUF2029 domain-containing protein [Crocinitomicaceae bacterium]
MQPLSRTSIFAFILSFVFLSVLALVGYETPREEFGQFILLYMASFAIFYSIWINHQKWKFYHFFILALLARLVLLFAAPELSNDFYRFIWDGELITRGVNPYAHTPNELISQGPFYNDQYMRVLYHGMGDLSQRNYSCYPVFNQLLFYFPASLTDSVQTNVILLKIVVMLGDVGVILIGRKLLRLLGKSEHLIWLYALNPFIILEFAGNLHFEGVMIFFILLSIYYVLLDKWLFAAVFFGIAIQIKLIPILLLPFLFKKMKWKRSLGFTAMTTIVVLLLGVMMISPRFFDNMMSSVNLYFTQFEFNASLFYLVREISLATVGWDEIAFYGPLFSKLAVVGVGLLAVFKAYRNESSIFTGMLFALVIYYAFATTVHPWYISLVLIFSIFTQYKFGLVWSLLIMLSYFAYSNPAFEENLLLVLIEYLLVFGIMIYEIIRNTNKKDFGLQLKSFFSDHD